MTVILAAFDNAFSVWPRSVFPRLCRLSLLQKAGLKSMVSSMFSYLKLINDRANIRLFLSEGAVRALIIHRSARFMSNILIFFLFTLPFFGKSVLSLAP
jgi:hypothetical protein